MLGSLGWVWIDCGDHVIGLQYEPTWYQKTSASMSGILYVKRAGCVTCESEVLGSLESPLHPAKSQVNEAAESEPGPMFSRNSRITWPIIQYSLAWSLRQHR